MIIALITIAILLIFSAFFSGSETAFSTLTIHRIKHLVEKNKLHSEKVLRYKENPRRLLTIVLIGNNVMNIGASTLAAFTGAQLLRALGFSLTESTVAGIVTAVLTMLVLIWGEITPKSYASRNAETFCFRSVRIIRFFEIIFYPLIPFLEWITTFMISEGKDNQAKISEEELKTILKMSAKEGSIKKREVEMIKNIFRLDDVTAKVIMTPKSEISTMNGAHSLKDSLKKIKASTHSRIPIFLNSRDHYIGILYVRDVLQVSDLRNAKSILLKDLVKPAFYVPENIKIDHLLKQFLKKRIHIAIVVDEYGTIKGLVTVEDILEEIVGEIYDETDETQEMIERVSQKEFRVVGTCDIADINEKVGIKISTKKDFDTISGYILDKINRIPKKGEEIDGRGFTLQILEVKRNAIQKVKILKK